MNFELTALTVPQAAVAPLPKLPSTPPPKKQVKPPRKKQVPSKPAPRPEREREPEPEAAPPPQDYPRRNRTDAALDEMIGSFNSRPRSGPNIDYSAPIAPNRGMGEALRQDAAIRDRFGRRHRDREREHRRPRQPTTPRETTPQSTPQSMPQEHHDVPRNEPGPVPVTGPASDSFDVR